MNPDLFRTTSLQDGRVARVLAASIEAVDPARLVTDALAHNPIPPHQRVYILGIGKAAQAMTLAAASIIPEYTKALIITKHAAPIRGGVPQGSPQSGAEHAESGRITIMEAGHPVPDERSLAAGRAALELASAVEVGDLLVCLISGGGSALATAPVQGVALQDLQHLTAKLLASGATIDEINTLRRQLDRLKGGGLAAASQGSVISFILSDVPGDHLEDIASGPTVSDPTTKRDAINILDRYRIDPPPSISGFLRSSAEPNRMGISGRIENNVIGNNRLAMRSAARQAETEGFRVQLLDDVLQGEARQTGLELARRLSLVSEQAQGPFCIVAGGETTVRVTGTGKGGRNQELALAGVKPLADLDDHMMVTLATDGEDGPTDAAGAVVTGKTWQRAIRAGMSVDEYLDRNDAYPFFDALDDLLRTGPTGTNVNDLALLFRL